MKRLLTPVLPRSGTAAQLSEAEAKHALQVLRLRTGDNVIAMDAKGGIVLAAIRVAGDRVFLDYSGEAAAPVGADPLPITLEIGILKGEAMEWVVEKAVELNISRLVPLLTDHTVVQIDRKGPAAFQERWQRIADQALKQCGRLKRMSVESPIRLQEHWVRPNPEAGAVRLFCDEAERGHSPHLMNWLQEHWGLGGPVKHVNLLIGPEGGWSASERETLFAGSRARSGLPMETVSLGPWVLRGETAALFGMSLASGVLQSRSRSMANQA